MGKQLDCKGSKVCVGRVQNIESDGLGDTSPQKGESAHKDKWELLGSGMAF